MVLYSFNLLDCKVILSKNICLNGITATDNSIILSIDSISYKLYQGNEYYINSLYITLQNINAISNSISMEISECQEGYKLVNGICVRYIPTPIGNLTEGELYTIWIGVPILITVASYMIPTNPKQKL